MALQLTISQKEFSKKLKAVNGAIKPKNTNFIFDNILLCVSTDGCYLTASDNSTLIKSVINAIQYQGEIKICIPAKTIISAIKEIPDQPITLTIDDDYNIVVSYQTGHFEIKGIPADEYPVMRKDKGVELTLNCSDFIYNIRKARNFCSNNELRPVLTGVFFEANNTAVSFTASDSTKLCLLELPNTNLPDISSIISANDAKLIADIFDAKKNITIDISNNCSRYQCGDYEIISTNIEGRYPNVRNIIPMSQPLIFQLNRLEMISAIKRVSLFSNESSKLIVCHFDKKLKVEARDIDYSLGAEESLNIEKSNGSLKIGYNADMLIDILSAITTDSVEIRLSCESKAGVIKGVDMDNETYLLMPIAIQ